MSKPNRKRPSTSLTHSRIVDYTNLKDVKPVFFIPKNEISQEKITRFESARLEGKLPFISYDFETGNFVCHGFDNNFSQDDCVSLILKLQLIRFAKPDTKGKIGELLFFIPLEDFRKYAGQRHTYWQSAVLPDKLRSVWRPEYYDLRPVHYKTKTFKPEEEIYKNRKSLN